VKEPEKINKEEFIWKEGILEADEKALDKFGIK
jgi:hypothetical protein